MTQTETPPSTFGADELRRAAGLQFVLHWEETAMQYARVHWGLDPQTILI